MFVIRVALDCRMADWTGIGRFATGLARSLATRPEADVDLVQVVSRPEQAPVADVPFVVAGGHPFSPNGGMAMAAALRRVKPGVVHCTHFPTPLPAPHPLVVTLHDLAPMFVPGVMPSARNRAVYTWWNRRAARVADRLTVPSERTDADVLRLLAPAVPGLATRIRVVPHAMSDFAEGAVGELPPAGAEFDGRYVLGFGSTRPNKGLPTLLRAFASLSGDHPDVALVLVGQPVPDVVEKTIGDVPAVRRIRFTGPVDDDELRVLYAHAAAFAFPSSFEGFGLPPLEAMAFGTPVVTTTAGSLPEVVGDAAIMVEPDDAPALAVGIERLLDDAEERDRLVAAGRERAARFTFRRTSSAMVDVYREVAS